MENLKEWAIAFVKNKDLVQKKLVDYKEHEDRIDFNFKDKKQTYFIEDVLNEKLFDKIKNTENKTVICSNSEENLKFLIKNWDKLSKERSLNFIFVNLKLQDKWQINPYIHSSIADKSSLKSGLKAMFDAANGKNIS
jgi:hypothetical protein